MFQSVIGAVLADKFRGEFETIGGHALQVVRVVREVYVFQCPLFQVFLETSEEVSLGFVAGCVFVSL